MKTALSFVGLVFENENFLLFRNDNMEPKLPNASSFYMKKLVILMGSLFEHAFLNALKKSSLIKKGSNKI